MEKHRTVFVFRDLLESDPSGLCVSSVGTEYVLVLYNNPDQSVSLTLFGADLMKQTADETETHENVMFIRNSAG